MANLLSKLFGSPTERALKQYRQVVERINAHEPALKALSDDALKAKTAAFKQRLANGEKLDDLLPEAYATVREASVRTTGMRHFDVQMIGGIVLHEGRIAEMRTGEGKTLVATLPLYLNALAGRGAHLVTPNDYLSKVGVQQMGPIYHALGLTVGVIQNSGTGDPNTSSYLYDPAYASNDARLQYLRPCLRRDAYAADITYGTNNEFGFDYLRDNMVMDKSQLAQRELFFAIIDEVDNILIDEARTPLIISGQADEPSDLYRQFARVVKNLKPSSDASITAKEPDGDYVVEEKDRVAYLTDKGVEKVQRAIGVDHIYSPEHSDMIPYLDNSLRAHALYHSEKEYIVENGQVVIVDEFTGRMMYGRRFSEGLHQAIEAKEGVEIRRENLTMATITFQNFFRMYTKICGMTGTAMTEAEEFEKIYNLDVFPIPTHREMIRADYEDLIYPTEAAKFKAVIDFIKERQAAGQPILVGTVAVETSERLSKALQKVGVKHQVLNAKQHEREAEIITQAGRSGSVTIATNMAGRGVDILLGGNPEGLARQKIVQSGQQVTEVAPDAWETALADARVECDTDKKKVLELGGLLVIGTERHEARRIDNQLRGRAGRQGDPGESRFFLSLEDELMRRFGGDRIKGIMEWASQGGDEPLEHPWVSKAIGQAQVRVEGYNFDIRKRVLEYDNVVNKQREVIYRQRRELLDKTGLHDDYLKILEEQVTAAIDEFCPDEMPAAEWDIDGLYRRLLAIYPVPAAITPDTLRGKSLDDLEAVVLESVETAYQTKLKELSPENNPNFGGIVERWAMLSSIDKHWRRHLTDLDVLREGIGLMAIAQRDPLVEYKREAFAMWEELQTQIAADAVKAFMSFRQQPQQPAAAKQPGVAAPLPLILRRPVVQAVRPGQTAAPAKAQPVKKTAEAKLGRNDPCHCGSGKKYKDCHLKIDQKSGVTNA